MAKQGDERDPRLVAFGSRVRRAREEAGLTQRVVRERLAERGVHFPATALAKLENGTRPTTVVELQGLADVLQAPVSQLIESASAENQVKPPAANKVWRLRLDDAHESHDRLRAAGDDYVRRREDLADASDDYIQALTELGGTDGAPGRRYIDGETRRVRAHLDKLPADPADVLRRE